MSECKGDKRTARESSVVLQRFVIKPCLHCGSKMEIHGDFPHGSLGIHCTKRGCIADINGGCYTNKEELIKAHNQRAL